MHVARRHWATLATGLLLGGLVPAVTAAPAGADTPLPPECATKTYGFAGATDLTLNSRAAVVGDRLRVTYADFSGAGSAFSTDKIELHDDGSFSTEYQFQFSSPGGGGADGLVFTVQNVSNQVGSIGGGLGYQGVPNSIGIELDDWYNSGYDEVGGTASDNHVGIDVNGDINSVVRARLDSLMTLDAGNPGFVWVDYDGATDQLEVRVATTRTRPAAPILTHTVDLPDVLGGSGADAEEAFVGFTAATGAAYANFDVLDWTFNNCYHPVGVDASPTADAGGPYAGHRDEPVSLSGTVGDDAPGVTQQWSVTGQPLGATCTFDDASAAVTTVTCDRLGDYELTLTARDSIGQETSDTASLALSNRAPVASPPALTATTACSVDATVDFSDPDGADTHSVDFDWGDGAASSGTVDQTADTATGSHTYAGAGTYTVTATVSDGTDLDTASTSYTTKNQAGAFLQPINAAGTRSVFKLGSTIPVKIVVTDCDGAKVGTLAPTVHLTKLDSASGSVNEVPADVVATNGRQMTWMGDRYQFNLSTKRSIFADGADLTAGSYRITVTDPSLVGAASTVVDLR